MSVLIDNETRVLIQGLSSKTAQRHALSMVENNTKIVAGVVPMKGGGDVAEWPLYDTVQQALDDHDVDLALIYAPPHLAAEAISESIEARIPLIVCVTEGIPIHDMLKVKKRLLFSNSTLLGPCCPGVTSPGKAKAGFIPDEVCLPGRVGVVGKSGTLTYEICYQLKKQGIGQSTIVGIGGDPIKGLQFKDVLKMFQEDDETDIVVMVGEIGGREEELAAEYVQKFMSKPVIAYIAGKTAPQGIPMGHAGALVSGKHGNHFSKVSKLKTSGIYVAESIFYIPNIVKSLCSELESI